MGYLGREPQIGFTETVKDSFNGDNSTTAFTMSQAVSLDTDIEVFVGNVQQEPGSGKAYVVSGTTLTFSEAPPTGTANIYVIHRNSLQGTLFPPQNLGDKNYLIGGNLSLDADSAALKFGADSDITLTHSADTGLILKNTSTTGNSGIGAVLTLQTGDTDIAVNNILGSIQFQAPDEGTGTDAILVAGKMEVLSEGNFSSSNNATSMRFLTGNSAAAGSDGGSMILGSTGNLTLKDLRTADGSSARITLQSGDTDIAQDDIIGQLEFQAPDEATGTDAILMAAAIGAVSEGDFSSSSNATKLSFKTGASEAATEKMSLSSAGNLTVSGDVSVGDDLSLASDSAVLKFGADSEITLTHSADTGLILKHAATADDSFPTLTLQTGDTDIAQGDVLGRIAFQAPDEGTGTDAITVPVNIEAVSQGDFSSSNNATSLVINTSVSAAAGSAGDGGKFSFVGNGEFIVRSMATGDGNFPVLSLNTGETNIEADDVLGFIGFQAPDEGTGTDAILISAGIAAVSEGDFSSSSNATSLQFRTGSSEAASEKMRLTSSGALIIDNSGNVKTKVDGVNDDNEGVKGSGAQLQLHGATPVIDVFSYSTTNGTHGGINFMKSRNNTVGTNTTITTGDIIGSIQFGGFDGVDYASIMGKIDFQAGGSGMAENDTAGEMVFYTTADGSGGSGSSERMRIASTGKIGIGGTLGTAHLFVQDPLEGTSTQIATIKAKGSSYGTEAVNIFSERAADTAFSFMRMHSNDNADVEFNFRGDGQGLADGGTFNNPADYAEFFEWKDGNSSDEDRIGYSVILDGNKIVKATSSDDTSKIVGVISGNPVIVGDCAWNRWESKFVKDDYNRYVREEYTVTEWKDSKGELISYMTDEIPSDVTVPSDAKVISTEVDGVTKLTRRKVNSSWDKSKTYIPREDRKEWDMVGMVGKLYLRKGQPTGDRWIKMKDISDTVEEWLVR